MGVDTVIYIPDIMKKDIQRFLEFIAEDVKIEDSNIDDDYKIILFKYKNEKRMLHCHLMHFKKEDYIKKVISRYDISKEEAEDWWNVDQLNIIQQSQLPLNTTGQQCSLGYWGHNIEIMKEICYYFGGYIDESDSDSEEFYKIEKNKNEIIPLIFEE